MSQEKILIVENSLEDRDLIARQSLKPLGYDVRTTELASTGIQLALSLSPDLIITNLNLPDLSGKDLLVALHSQNISIPVVVVSNEGQEQDVIQAFRLGATDVIKKPLREAEVVATVERVLQSVRLRREQEQRLASLEENTRALQRSVSALSRLVSAGKAVAAADRPKAIFAELVTGTAQLTESQRSYFLVRADQEHFHLAAYHNLPKTLSGFLNRPFDDGISFLVAASGKTLVMHGEALKRFKIGQLGKAVMVTPVKVQSETIGLLATIRTRDAPFTRAEQKLVESLADFAAITLVHFRQIQGLENRAADLQSGRDRAGKTRGTGTP